MSAYKRPDLKLQLRLFLSLYKMAISLRVGYTGLETLKGNISSKLTRFAAICISLVTGLFFMADLFLVKFFQIPESSYSFNF